MSTCYGSLSLVAHGGIAAGRGEERRGEECGHQRNTPPELQNLLRSFLKPGDGLCRVAHLLSIERKIDS